MVSQWFFMCMNRNEVCVMLSSGSLLVFTKQHYWAKIFMEHARLKPVNGEFLVAPYRHKSSSFIMKRSLNNVCWTLIAVLVFFCQVLHGKRTFQLHYCRCCYNSLVLWSRQVYALFNGIKLQVYLAAHLLIWTTLRELQMCDRKEQKLC